MPIVWLVWGDAVTTGGTVADNVKKQKGLSEQATAESPGLTVVGHLTGAAVTGLGVGSLVSGVPALEALSAATNVSKYGTASAVAFETGLAGPSVGVAAHTFQTVGSDMLSNLSPPPINTGEAKTAAKKER